MMHQWRHLKMLKRSGRGHDISGVSGTKTGELAILCPACPQPGKNLPEGWEDAPTEKRQAHLPCMSHFTDHQYHLDGYIDRFSELMPIFGLSERLYRHGKQIRL
jgi:hypothetical protein